MSRRLALIDLFAGCGGLTKGFVDSGRFSPVAAVEHDVHAAATYAHNFGDHVEVDDVASWASGSLPRADVVVGGPPCQGFSTLGKRDPVDPRNDLWRHYVSTIQRVRPAFFLLENVPAFLKSTQFGLLSAETQVGGRLSSYALEAHVLSASDYGVAQARKRAVVVGRPRSMRPLGAPAVRLPRRTIAEAFPDWLTPEAPEDPLPLSSIEFRGKSVPGPYRLRDLHVSRRPSDLALERIRAIPAGGSRVDLPANLRMRCWNGDTRGSGDVMGRMRWDRPAVTIRTEFFKPEKGRFLHPDQNRPITHAEAALIQGFTEDFTWYGTMASIARQIGNAVPPPLAAALAERIAESIAD